MDQHDFVPEHDVLALQSYGSAAETIDCKSMVSCISHPSAIQEESYVSEVSRIGSPVSPAPTDRLA